MRANTMAAMILAGGRGTRLLDLTKKVAKPAVHFGGKYRIIDFRRLDTEAATVVAAVVAVVADNFKAIINQQKGRLMGHPFCLQKP